MVETRIGRIRSSCHRDWVKALPRAATRTVPNAVINAVENSRNVQLGDEVPDTSAVEFVEEDPVTDCIQHKLNLGVSDR